MSITEKVLSEEGYVEIDPNWKESAEFKFAHVLKEAIRSHKWNRGTEGVQLNWAAAKEEWFRLHYQNFLAWLKPFKPKKKIRDRIRTRGGRSREPIIRGHYV